MIDLSIEVPQSVRDRLDSLSDSVLIHATEAAVEGVETALRKHFRALQRRPRRDGLRSSGFWLGTDGNSVAEQIHAGSTRPDGSAEIEIASPELAHKISGGTIKASAYGHKYLTIPANDEAVASPRGARGFNTKIMWVEHPDGGVRPALVAADNYVKTSRARSGRTRRTVTQVAARANAGSGDVLYWLVRQVTHQPMSDALPADSTLADAALDAAEDALAALVQGDAA